MTTQLDRIEGEVGALSEKLNIHISRHVAADEKQEDHEEILHGPDKKSGLILTVGVMEDRLRLIYIMLGALGTATLGLIVGILVFLVTSGSKL